MIRENHLILIAPYRADELTVVSPIKMLQIMFHERFLDHPDFDSWRERFFNLFDLSVFNRGRPNRIMCYKLSKETASIIRAILSQVLHEYVEKSPNYQEMIRLKFIEILLSLYRSLPQIDSERIKRGSLSIEIATEYIKMQYAYNFSLPFLANLCGLAPSYFSRLFREKTGVPVFEFINRIRVQKACGLLKRTEDTIIDIAFSVGYNNISFFNRYFRKIMNMSPREYRKFIKK